MPYADPKQRARAARESDKRQGRRNVTLNLDRDTAEALDRAAQKYGGKVPAIRELLKNLEK